MEVLQDESLLDDLYWKMVSDMEKYPGNEYFIKDKLRFYANEMFKKTVDEKYLIRDARKVNVFSEMKESATTFTVEEAKHLLSSIWPNGNPKTIIGFDKDVAIQAINAENIEPVEEDYGQFNRCWVKTYNIYGIKHDFIMSSSEKEFDLNKAECTKWIPWE